MALLKQLDMCGVIHSFVSVTKKIMFVVPVIWFGSFNIQLLGNSQSVGFLRACGRVNP